MYRSVLLLLALVLCAYAHQSKWDDETNPLNIRRVEENILTRADNEPSYRLPNNTYPEAYDISLITRIHAGDFAFSGIVRISIATAENTSSSIVLHHRQLTITDVKLWTVDVTPVEIAIGAHSYVLQTELLTIPVTNGLSANTKYTLVIEYTGELRLDNGGFYRSSYVNEQGVRRWLGTTQFESTNARHGFPSYDEPALKANFTISITHDASYHAISNMPSTGRQPSAVNAGMVTTSFATTPPTSTYLIAYIVSDFESVTNANASSVFPHRVFARPNAINQTALTLEAGEKILTAIENFLEVPYTLPKMDQAAIPDFSPGAMENWGLVTYRESIFFYDEAVSVYTTKTSIVTVIAHEFGHQWFGNLVSPKWWTYIWLNEGFATLFEHYGVDFVYPEWKILDFFVVDTLQNVFNSDSLETTRPMTHYVESAYDVSRLFDNIAYAKSGCVLRMILHALSEQSFRKGLRYYLTDNSYEASVEDDLFAGLEKAVKEDRTLAADLDVRTIMLSWTRQKGYPVLHVTRNYTTGTVTIEQERYLTNSSSPQSNSTWWIPYNFVTGNNPDFNRTVADDWLPEGTRQSIINQSAQRTWTSQDWLVFNKQQTGYYRVKYDLENYKLIAKTLNSNDFENIHLVSRSQIIDDLFHFAQTNRLSFRTVFDVIRYLNRETEYVPWASAGNGLVSLNRVFAGNEHFKKFVRDMTVGVFSTVGIEDVPTEPHLRKYARTLAINWACNVGLPACLDQTTEKLRQIISTNGEVHQNIRSVFYCAALRNSSASEYGFVQNRLHTTNNQDYRNLLITALGCTSSTTLLQAYLNTALNSTTPRNATNYKTGEQIRVFNAVYQSGPIGLSSAISYLVKNIDEAYTTHGDNQLGTVLIGIAQRVVSQDDRTLFVTLTESVRTNNYTSEANINRAVNLVEQNVQFLATHKPDVDAWLKEYNGASSTTVSLVTMALVAVAYVMNMY